MFCNGHQRQRETLLSIIVPMAHRIQDFDKLLVEQFEQDKPLTAEQKARGKRIRNKAKYWGDKVEQAKMDNKNDPTAKRPVDVLAKFEEQVAKRAKQHDDDEKNENNILHLLTKQAEFINQQGDRIDAFQRSHNNRVEAKQREYEEDRQVFLALVKGTGLKEPTPAVIPTVHDTPLRPKNTRSVTPDDFLATPARRQLSKAMSEVPVTGPHRIDFSKAASMPNMGTIDEDEELNVYGDEKLFDYAIVVCKDTDGGSELLRGHFEGRRIDGFAQVLDCAVTLQQGKVVPVQFIDQGMKMSQEALIPLETEEPIQSIMSHGSILLAKSAVGNFFYLWMYIPNTGNVFLGGTKFKFQVEADAFALIDGAVVGFDADLKSNKHYGVLRKAPFSFDDGEAQFVMKPHVVDRRIYLPKNRIATKKILAAHGNKTYFLADKKDGKKSFSHMFVEEDAGIVKLGGFGEGMVTQLAGNDTDLYVLTRSGTIHSLMKGFGNDQWDAYKGASDVSRIVASGACCIGLKSTNTDVVFLYPEDDAITSRSVLEDGLSQILHIDGSAGYAAILGFAAVEDERAKGAEEEGTEDPTEDSKPVEDDTEDESIEMDSKPAAK